MTTSHTTIYDVARQARVSPATVSRVLSHKSIVARDTRQRVLDAAHQLQFTTNRVASGLRRGRSDAISMVLPYNTPELMDAAQLAANDQQYTLMVNCTFKPSVDAETRALEMALDHQVAGVIWQPSGEPEDYAAIVPRLQRSQTTVVMLERGREIMPGADLIYHDTAAAAREAIDHLTMAGYETLFYLTRDDGYRLRRQRREEVEQAAGDRVNVLSCPSVQQVAEALGPALIAAPGPVGIYTDGDWTALAAAKCVESLGLSIPGDVGLIAMGDMLIGGVYRIGELANPSLTVVQRQQSNLARRCVARLLERIEDAEAECEPQCVPVRLPLVARQSTDRRAPSSSPIRIAWPDDVAPGEPQLHP